MAHFRGTLQGSRGETSRLGGKASGLEAVVASWQGAVTVRLYHDAKTGTDMAWVGLTKHRGAGVERTLYDGPVNPVAAAIAANAA